MVGLYNFGDDAAYQGEIPGYINDINNMVNEAKAANIKVILVPSGPTLADGMYLSMASTLRYSHTAQPTAYRLSTPMTLSAMCRLNK